MSDLLFDARQAGKTAANLLTPEQTAERIHITVGSLAVWRATMPGISEPPRRRAR